MPRPNSLKRHKHQKQHVHDTWGNLTLTWRHYRPDHTSHNQLTPYTLSCLSIHFAQAAPAALGLLSFAPPARRQKQAIFSRLNPTFNTTSALAQPLRKSRRRPDFIAHRANTNHKLMMTKYRRHVYVYVVSVNDRGHQTPFPRYPLRNSRIRTHRDRKVVSALHLPALSLHCDRSCSRRHKIPTPPRPGQIFKDLFLRM